MQPWITDEDNIVRASLQPHRRHPNKYVVEHAHTSLWRSEGEIQRREARAKDLVMLAPGAYYPLAWWRRHFAEERFRLLTKAHVTRGSGTIITGDAAAVMHGLPALIDGARISLANCGRKRGVPRTLPGDNARHPRYIANSLVRHVAGGIQEVDIVTIDGRLVTDIPKTVVDVCRSRNSPNGLLLADAALRHHCTKAQLEAVLQAYPRSPGNKKAREIIARATAYSESTGESLTKELIIKSGIADVGCQDSPLLQQVDFFDELGHVGRVDFYLPELNLVIEFDGDIKYRNNGGRSSEEAWSAERKREKRLRNLQLHFLRLTWKEVRDSRYALRLQRLADSIRKSIAAGGLRFEGEARLNRRPVYAPYSITEKNEERRLRWLDAGRLAS